MHKGLWFGCPDAPTTPPYPNTYTSFDGVSQMLMTFGIERQNSYESIHVNLMFPGFQNDLLNSLLGDHCSSRVVLTWLSTNRPDGGDGVGVFKKNDSKRLKQRTYKCRVNSPASRGSIGRRDIG